MPSKNYYEVLEISADATPETIKEQYRFLLHAWHPDKFPNPQQKLWAQERTKEINEAYRILSDPKERAKYDLLLRGRATQSFSPGEQHASTYTYSQQQTAREKWRAEYVRQRQQEAEAERQRVEAERQQYVKEQAERLRAEQQRSSQATKNPGNWSQAQRDFPVACQHCGRSDASLRWSVFPYVVSIFILTFRRAWGGLYCGRCRRREMFKAKLLTFLFGWWGVPWGVFYTIGVLFKSDDGETPADVNADYLKALGAYFFQSKQLGEALLTFNASLQLRRDVQLEQLVSELFGKTSISPISTARGKGIGFTPAMLGVVAAIVLASWLSPLFSQDFFALTPANNRPEEQPGRITREPTATRIPTRVPATPTATLPAPEDWRLYKSKRAYFSAYIPGDWAGSYYPPSANDPLRGVVFAPSAALQDEDATTISVMSLPLPDVADAQAMTPAELKQGATSWLLDRKLKAIRLPVEMEIGGHAAVWMVHEAELQDKNYKVRGYVAMVSTPQWFYFIEVVGLAEYDEVVHDYFDEFIRHFRTSPE